LKDRETQLAFIKARAEGKSYGTISKELGISKATCTSWEKTLRDEIDALRQEQLDELYTAYSMTREARIKALGSIVQELDKAIATKALDELSPDKLLDLRLKYGRELKAEFREPVAGTDATIDGIIEQYDQLLQESTAGNASPAEVKAQLSILGAKLDALQKVAGEYTKEENSQFGRSPLLGYTSRLIRHEDRRDA